MLFRHEEILHLMVEKDEASSVLDVIDKLKRFSFSPEKLFFSKGSKFAFSLRVRFFLNKRSEVWIGKVVACVHGNFHLRTLLNEKLCAISEIWWELSDKPGGKSNAHPPFLKHILLNTERRRSRKANEMENSFREKFYNYGFLWLLLFAFLFAILLFLMWF